MNRSQQVNTQVENSAILYPKLPKNKMQVLLAEIQALARGEDKSSPILDSFFVHQPVPLARALVANESIRSIKSFLSRVGKLNDNVRSLNEPSLDIRMGSSLQRDIRRYRSRPDNLSKLTIPLGNFILDLQGSAPKVSGIVPEAVLVVHQREELQGLTARYIQRSLANLPVLLQNDELFNLVNPDLVRHSLSGDGGIIFSFSSNQTTDVDDQVNWGFDSNIAVERLHIMGGDFHMCLRASVVNFINTALAHDLEKIEVIIHPETTYSCKKDFSQKCTEDLAGFLVNDLSVESCSWEIGGATKKTNTISSLNPRTKRPNRVIIKSD